jgi:hypothetical protein
LNVCLPILLLQVFAAVAAALVGLLRRVRYPLLPAVSVAEFMELVEVCAFPEGSTSTGRMTIR